MLRGGPRSKSVLILRGGARSNSKRWPRSKFKRGPRSNTAPPVPVTALKKPGVKLASSGKAT